MRIEPIPYSELRLFAGILPAYAGDFSRVAEYYAGNPAQEEDLRRSAEIALARRCPREAVAKALEEYNRRLGAQQPTLANIRKLRSDNCAAVVAGQQPGLLGGPLYTIYKALTAIRLATFLDESGVPCVPIFWNASDGHDADEYATLLMPPKDNGAVMKRLAEVPESASAFDVPVTRECVDLVEEFLAALPETEFRNEIINGIISVYRGDLAESFTRFTLRLLSKHGLIMFEPRLLRREAAGIIAREIESRGESSAAIRDAAQRLRGAGYVPPFSGDEGIKVLIYENGRRQRLQAAEDGFRTRERKYSTAELLDMLEREPARFTPDAALRPITQDALLPTAVYVAGPTEIAYLAQLKKVYEFFGVPMPVAYPRASATLVENSIGKFLGNFGMGVKEFLNDAQPPEDVRNSGKDDRVEKQFAEMLAEIGKHLEELREITLKYEPTLQKPFEKVERNIKAELTKLKDKAVAAQLNRLGIGRRQWSRICDSLLPAGKLQERVETIVPWLCKYGGGLLEELLETLPLTGFHHSLVYLT
jgi:bacillithiol biosynthesis cysteine-adding enzyme BshC